jgi:hypothetical protein
VRNLANKKTIAINNKQLQHKEQRERELPRQLRAFFTVEGSIERCRERKNTDSSVSSLLGKSLAQTGAKLVLGTASDIFQVS